MKCKYSINLFVLAFSFSFKTKAIQFKLNAQDKEKKNKKWKNLKVAKSWFGRTLSVTFKKKSGK